MSRLRQQRAYEKVRQRIVMDILRGRHAPGCFLPAERELADAFGVTRDTIRRALQDLEREGRIVHEKNRRPRVAPARRGATGVNANLVAFISPVPYTTGADDDYNEFTGALLVMTRKLAEHGLHVAFFNSHSSAQDERDVALQALSGHYAGIVYFPCSLGRPHRDILKSLSASSTPVVVVQDHVGSICPRLSTIDLDDFHGGYIATKHLIEKGHRKILHLSSTENGTWIADRRRGYEKALTEHGGASSKPRTIHLCPFDRVNTDAAWRRFPFECFKTGTTAVFAHADRFADIFCRIACAKGLRVPDDVSVVGFGNVHTETPLTTVSHMTKEIGERAAELLVKKMNPDFRNQVHHEVIEPKLVVRTSVIQACNTRTK